MKKVALLFFDFCLCASCFAHQTVTVGIQKELLLGADKELIYETIKALKQKLPKTLEIREYSTKDLKRAVQNNEVNLMFSSSIFFTSMERSGVRDIATAVSERAFDPNYGNSAVILSNYEDNIENIESLRNRKIAYNPDLGFESVLYVKGELVRLGLDQRQISNSLVSARKSIKELVDGLYKKQWSAVLLPSCLLETEASQQKINSIGLRVTNEKVHPNLRCVHSTDVYPNLTFSTLPSVNSELSRQLSLILLQLKPTKNGNYWGSVSDFDGVNSLLRSLDLDAYADDRKWTLEKVLQQYWMLFLSLLLLLLGLLAHSVRSEYLVKKRTAELSYSISEKEKLQEEATQTQEALGKLQRLSAINQLSSLFAHELRQPLNAIRCYAYSLKKQTLRRADLSELENYINGLNEISEQVKRADEIIQKVRDYVKHNQKETIPVNLKEILQKTIQNFLLGHSDCKFTVSNISEDEVVLSEPLELELMLSNLIRNSYEASIGCKERRVFVKGSKGKDTYSFSIWDNGPKIDKDYIESFIVKQYSSKTDGLGLGLSIVETFIKRQGGSLKFSQSIGGGLLVELTLLSVNQGDKNEC